ncbi:hypothetical protein Bca101_059898 [Brassica carinata]
MAHQGQSSNRKEVVKELVASYGPLIMEAIDSQGNTALHVAAYRGHADLVEDLISASPSLISARNNAGVTFLHSGISGFQTTAFERLDKHTELMNRLITYAASMTPYVSASPISCKLGLARGTKIMNFIASHYGCRSRKLS